MRMIARMAAVNVSERPTMTFSSYASLFSSLVIFSAADEEVALAVAVAALVVECTAAFVATARRTVTKWVAVEVEVEVDEDIVGLDAYQKQMRDFPDVFGFLVRKENDCYQSRSEFAYCYRKGKKLAKGGKGLGKGKPRAFVGRVQNVCFVHSY